MSHGPSANLAGGLQVPGGGGEAPSPTSSTDPYAPQSTCSLHGPCTACSCKVGGFGGGSDGGGTGTSQPPVVQYMSACPCLIGTCPPSVPGPGAPYSSGAVTVENPSFGPEVSGLLITCIETGATQAGTCSGVTFYLNDSGIHHFTAYAGQGTNCFDGHSYFYTYDHPPAVAPAGGNAIMTVTRH